MTESPDDTVRRMKEEIKRKLKDLDDVNAKQNLPTASISSDKPLNPIPETITRSVTVKVVEPIPRAVKIIPPIANSVELRAVTKVLDEPKVPTATRASLQEKRIEEPASKPTPVSLAASSDNYNFYSTLFTINPIVNKPLHIYRPIHPYFSTRFTPITFGPTAQPRVEIIKPRKESLSAAGLLNKYKGYFDA